MCKTTNTGLPLYSDQELLVLLRDVERREQGFRMLVECYQETLYWQVRRLVGCHDDANDVLQNCFLKIYRAIDKFKGDAKLYTWMFRIARNEAYTFIKRRRRSLAIDGATEQQYVASLEADPYFDGTEVQCHLHAAIATLPLKQREVFVLRYFEDKSYRELSELLNTSQGGLKANFHHAVAKIEAYLKTIKYL